jgi:MSHA pilin protein MshA
VKGRTQQGGFTLIELVVVITILGILAAFAIPRFANLEGQARTAAVQGLSGSLRSGASLAHAMWLAQGNPASTTVNMEGQVINMTFGYPNAATIQRTIVDLTGFLPTTVGGDRRFTKAAANGTTPIANCFVTYTPAAAVNTAPAVAVTATGC